MGVGLASGLQDKRLRNKSSNEHQKLAKPTGMPRSRALSIQNKQADHEANLEECFQLAARDLHLLPLPSKPNPSAESAESLA